MHATIIQPNCVLSPLGQKQEMPSICCLLANLLANKRVVLLPVWVSNFHYFLCISKYNKIMRGNKKHQFREATLKKYFQVIIIKQIITYTAYSQNNLPFCNGRIILLPPWTNIQKHPPFWSEIMEYIFGQKPGTRLK